MNNKAAAWAWFLEAKLGPFERIKKIVILILCDLSKVRGEGGKQLPCACVCSYIMTFPALHLGICDAADSDLGLF